MSDETDDAADAAPDAGQPQPQNEAAPSAPKKEEPSAPKQDTAANPAERLLAEAIALFDSDIPVGEKKSQLAAIVRTLLDKNASRDQPTQDKPKHDDERSSRVVKRSEFLPVQPRVQFTPTAGPTSSYDALKRPGR